MEKEIKNIWVNPDWKTMGDSMCFDSGTNFLSATVSTENGDVDILIQARGSVKVYYKDEMFKCASQMPQELIDKFKDDSAWDDDDCEIIDSNWWELFWDYNGNTDCFENAEVFNANPMDFKNEQEIKEWLLEFAFGVK